MSYGFLLIVFPALVIYAAVSDLLSLTISNRVSIGLIVSFFIAAFLSGMPLDAIGWHIAAGLIALAVGFVCFGFGWIGGGDAKVAACVILWFGMGEALSFLLLSSVIGGALTLVLLMIRSRPLPTWAMARDWISRLHDPKSGVPYGIALAAAALIIYPNTVWMNGTGF